MAQRKPKARKTPTKGKSRRASPAPKKGARSGVTAKKGAPPKKAAQTKAKKAAAKNASALKKAAAKKAAAQAKAKKAAEAKAKKAAAAAKVLAARKALEEKKRDLLRKAREQEAEKKRRAQEKERSQKELAKKRAEAERQKVTEKKARDKAAADTRKEKERERKEAQKERDRLAKEKAKEKLKAEKAAADARKQKEKEQLRLLKEREAQKIAENKAKEEERARLKAEKEAAKAREKAEREAERERVREEARKRKEEERALREAERDAYRKAKETEQARLRAEREAARRALEGRVVRATRASRAAAGGRLATTTRVYTPSSIPDQSRTRRADEGVDQRFANLRVQVAPPPREDPRPIPRTIPPPPAPPPAATVEERYARITERLGKTDEQFRREYDESFLMSWIYHDSALEGVVYTYDELRMAINPNITVVPDSSMQTVCDEIRRHKAAIEFVKDQADKKRVPLTIDTVKRIYLILHPEEGDLKTVKYRKDIPQHRLYFHEYAPPDKIAYKIRQVFDWLNGPEPKKMKNALRIAARVHYDLLRVFPFALDSGKVVRLFMNLMLMRADCPPALIHSTERQKYYEALRGTLPVIVSMVTEAISNALTSIEKLLDERDTKLRAF